MKLTMFLAVVLSLSSLAYAQEIDVEKFADAIRRAEGNSNYGVLSIPCKTEAKCRQICVNSIKNNLKRYEKSEKSTDFVGFMAKRWCPIGAENDPKGLNKNWAKNVRSIYARM
jgi:hypothetical protein